MLSRAVQIVVFPFGFIKRKIHSWIDKAYKVYGYVGNKKRELISLGETAKKDPKGFAKADILGRHIVLIDTRYTSDLECESQLKELMDLKEDCARSPYDFFDFFVGSKFFLSVNGEKGLKMRREMIPHFSTVRLPADIFHEMNDVLAQISSSNNGTEKIIKNWTLDFLMQHLAGIRLTEKLKAKLFELEDIAPAASMACLFVPHFILKWMPFARHFRRELHNEIKDFFREKLKTLRESPHLFDPDKWFVQVVVKKLPRGKSLKKMTDREIERLSVDPDLRACLALILGVRNISDALVFFIDELFPSKQSGGGELLFESIKTEIDRHYNLDAMDHNEMPYLHANYLEILRISQREHGIMRYSHQGFKTKDFVIPPKSFINTNFAVGLKKYNQVEKPFDYTPERFLETVVSDSKSEWKLNKEAVLHKGALTMFGIGPRMCAGHQLAEKIIKMFVILFTLRAQSFKLDPRLFVFNDPIFAREVETVALLKQSFFNRTKDNIEMQKSVSKITRVIADYQP